MEIYCRQQVRRALGLFPEEPKLGILFGEHIYSHTGRQFRGWHVLSKLFRMYISGHTQLKITICVKKVKMVDMNTSGRAQLRFTKAADSGLKHFLARSVRVCKDGRLQPPGMLSFRFTKTAGYRYFRACSVQICKDGGRGCFWACSLQAHQDGGHEHLGMHGSIS